MKLLLFIDHLSSGGAQRQLVLLACRLSARGHAVSVAVYREHDFHTETLRAAGIRVHRLETVARSRPAAALGRVRALVRLLDAEGFDAVVSFLSGPNLYALLASRRAKRRPIVVVSERSSAANPGRGPLARGIERLYGMADAVVLNAHHRHAQMQAAHPRLAPRLHTIWNGVDLDRFREHPLPARGDGLALVGVGQLGRFKQCHVLMRGLARYRERSGRDARLTWYARRYPALEPAEAAYKRELDALRESLGLGDAWTWHEETRALQDALPRHHALVHGSTVEGLPNVVCEALACGRPVVASDTLDHPRLVEAGRTGFLFAPGDPDALADALEALDALDDAAYAAMGRAARGFAEAELSAGAFADAFERLLRSLSDGARAAGGAPPPTHPDRAAS